MKNLFILVVFFSSLMLTVICQPGNPVYCSLDGTCKACGYTSQISNLFSLKSGYQCFIADCSKIGTNKNGFVCGSCTQYTFYDGTDCIQNCPQGQYANRYTQNNCQTANLGRLVKCSDQAADCSGCANNLDAISQFKFDSQTQQCMINDCSANVLYLFLNGFVCNSCYQAKGNGNVPSGQYYDPNAQTCVDTCPQGKYANQLTKFICVNQPNPGTGVSCSKNSKDCTGCQFANLFAYGSGNTCSVIDCKQSTINLNLNGWVCNSCSLAPGIGNIPQGQYYDSRSKTCVNTCPNNGVASADTNFICVTNPAPVPCSNDSSTCNGCGNDNSIQQLFQYVSGNNCNVINCSAPALNSTLSSSQNSNFAGWICRSCGVVTGANYPVLDGQYFLDTKVGCVSKCPDGYIANLATGYNCQQTNPGQDVACSNDSQTCNGCGLTSDIQNLFSKSKGSSCSAIDCHSKIIGSNLNGWICNSCQNASGSGNIAKGQYFDGKTCVSSCPTGQQANQANGFTCQYPPSPGSDVTCSTDSSTCGGCGSTNAIQNLFTRGKGINCSVTDCNLSIVGNNLNGWVCNSCSSASGNYNIPKGQFYDGKTCVPNCPNGQQASASTGFVCRGQGTDVACSSDSSTCGGCGSTTAIQGLFTHSKGNNCSVTDCSTAGVGSNLNGWVCNSCSQATGSGNIASGKYYNGSTCVSECPSGQSASVATGYVCKVASTPAAGNNASYSNLIGYVLVFAILNFFF
ncbi:hypothetical protein TTHERM_00634670 (macronuclear) [Tetrahymena thermophila SB210]|uniref:Immobilization antigen n=1 Tax=Tetrahymena thermophila (strain SB210) TaxID=312017 RepID=Q22WY5_TETTS|nr:hypothetical protein TTHERM_00634670 [Tetrahymena thermophila SB210]EAR89861.1 hypothetical protein TTHERM_00634670 [Tetrahymena thermophila SB210]|eukprot:XP_001010106.1 hypothetical protein TTHERM_00634670 [Tetrahymena thermophila SB210]